MWYTKFVIKIELLKTFITDHCRYCCTKHISMSIIYEIKINRKTIEKDFRHFIYLPKKINKLFEEELKQKEKNTK